MSSRKEVACFAAGTRIATPRGEKSVETLAPGDLVATRDNGFQEIAWIGHTHFTWAELAAEPHLKPVMIHKGALGHNAPERDLVVSPNHRLLIEEDETLVAARHLIDGDRILPVEAMGVTYVHFMFAEHQLVLSDGAWSESFQPVDFSLRAVGNAQRLEILGLFPELATREGIARYTAVRPERRPMVRPMLRH